MGRLKHLLPKSCAPEPKQAPECLGTLVAQYNMWSKVELRNPPAWLTSQVSSSLALIYQGEFSENRDLSLANRNYSICILQLLKAVCSTTHLFLLVGLNLRHLLGCLQPNLLLYCKWEDFNKKERRNSKTDSGSRIVVFGKAPCNFLQLASAQYFVVLKSLLILPHTTLNTGL